VKSQFAACARKAPFATAADAEQAARGKWGFYLCPICTRYHLTSAKAAAAGRLPDEEQKPLFDHSLLGIAKIKRPKADLKAVEKIAVCTGKPGPDGRIRVRLDRQEIVVGPVQPATLRPTLKTGVKVKVRIRGGQADFLGLP
jgi:hypothetical protein